jgi:hypothetical protein
MPSRRRGGLELVNWRQLELEQCGFPRSLAARVARDDRYDLQQLIELVQQGCSPALAVRILSPVEGSASTSERS